MKLIVSITLFVAYVVVSEYSSASKINSYAIAALFGFAYFLVALILFQYADFKKKNGGGYVVELVMILLALHIYGNRLQFDSISAAALVLLSANILFSVYFLSDIANDCDSVPNIDSFYKGAFGEYPIISHRALNKVRPLFWCVVFIPLVSYGFWLYVN